MFFKDRVHKYHAEATAFSGFLIQPLRQIIYPQAYAKLDEEGGYLAQRSENFSIEQVLSYKSAYTQVTGQLDPKEGLGWSTLSTSVIEGFNVLDILTVDRIVSQISTVHPPEGYLPTVSFLGTRLENVRINGHHVNVDLNLNIFGDQPLSVRANEDDFFDRTITRFSAEQIECMGLPPKLAVRHLEKREDEKQKSAVANGEHKTIVAQGSLATLSGKYPGATHGPTIELDDFGKIHFAPYKVTQSELQDGRQTALIEFTPLRLEMGCVASGNADACGCVVNGTTEP